MVLCRDISPDCTVRADLTRVNITGDTDPPRQNPEFNPRNYDNPPGMLIPALFFPQSCSALCAYECRGDDCDNDVTIKYVEALSCKVIGNGHTF